ncbi:MAG: helix-turn-helix domain-containing protein [Symploca sp. SIO2D2]|nr:helix-turn-helix domain-containing protein [Symploca sp. SIO2D2]NER45973.1 helix-turn-helix domain-containing protein [Symploca sp. SIO1A3]
MMLIGFQKEFPGLGVKIRKYRQNSGVELTQLAAQAGISTAYWHRIENEKVKVLPADTLRAIENALGVDFGVKFPE